jgi:hypothetical protein
MRTADSTGGTGDTNGNGGLVANTNTNTNTKIAGYAFDNSYKRDDFKTVATFNSATDKLGEQLGFWATDYENSGNARVGALLRTLSTDMWSIGDNLGYGKEMGKKHINEVTDNVAKKIDSVITELEYMGGNTELIAKLREISSYYWDVGDY